MAAVRVATLARVAARAADGGAAERAGCPQVDDDPAVRVQSDSELATRLSVESVDTRKHTGFQYMLRVLRVLSVSPVAAPFSPHCTMKPFFGTVLRGSRVLSVEYYSTASSYLHTPKHSTKKGCRTASSQHLGGLACSSASAIVAPFRALL